MKLTATDRRDKVYAWLGLLSRQMATSVSVNYAQGPIDVYINVAIYLLMARNRLDVLLHTTCRPLITDIAPSWVPRWDLKSAYDLFASQFDHEKIDMLAVSWFLPVFTDGKLPLAEMERLKYQRSVYGSAGFPVDICERNVPPQPNVKQYSDRPEFGKSLLPCLRIRAHLLDTVVQLMPKLTSQQAFIVPRTIVPAFGTLRSCELCLKQDNFTSHPPNLKDGEFIADSASPHNPWFIAQHRENLKDMARQFGMAKTPFRTVRSMGFSDRIIVGDSIWALSGLNVAVVLRKVEDLYMLMGDCYLYGATLDHPCGYCGRGTVPWPMVTEVIDIW
jgi:hypothetical protein